MNFCRRIAFFIVLFGLVSNASALTIGRMRGAALVGQPLDVTIQAQLSGDETPGALCAEADVFHADARQDASRVRVAVEGATSQTANIRVMSSTPVDEPVVTVYLKVGCNQKITRRFVMLADVPTEPAAAAPSLPVVAAPAQATPLATLPATSASPAAAAGVAPAPQDSGSNLPSAQAAPATPPPRAPAQMAKRPPAAAKPRPVVVKKATPKPAPVAKAAPKMEPKVAPPPPQKKEEQAAVPKDAASAASAKAKVEEKPPAAEAGQSRLKLDPMITLAERVTTLEATASAANAPSAEAAANDAKRVQTLEESVKTLVALAAKNEASMLDMRTRLQRAESERSGVPMAWLYGMGGLLLACLAGLAYLLFRQNTRIAAPERDDWWSASKGAPISRTADRAAVTMPPSGHGALNDGFAPGATVPVAPSQARPSARPVMRDDPDVDVSLVEMSESNFDNLMRSGNAHGALRRGPLPPSAEAPATRSQPMEVTRSINSEQIFDIRQQADFFVSLGQTDQAVRILENRINASGESSPLLYLDLLKIFHSLGLKQDYHQFREDFNLLFNSRVPEFASYASEGRSLEEYPQVLAHITALWPTPKAQMVIEASIFRDPLDGKSKPFELAAFRDLLLLHAIAQSNARGDTGISGLAPLSTVPVSPQRAGSAAGSHSLDVDISGPAVSVAKIAAVDIAIDGANSVMPPLPPAGADLDLDLSDLVGAGAKSTITRESEDATEYPNLLPDAPVPALPPLKKADKPVQAIEDNHYLDFDRNPTMRYTLPKSKDSKDDKDGGKP